MAETLNMMSVTIEDFIGEVGEQMDEKNYDPMIGIGKSGVGKTMSIYEFCQKRNIGFCELRLVTLTEVDLLGIPTLTDDGRTTYASNDLLPNVERDGEEGILVLDEITSATSTIRAAAYQLLDSKRALGNYKLPDKWKVIALGNGPDDGGVFQGMEHAFLSRAVCFRIEPDLDCWKRWAIAKGINPSVVAFLQFDNSWFHKMNVDEIASIFPCPRSWVALSKMLNAREQRKGRSLKDYEVMMLAAGAVGVEASSPFATFYKYNDKIELSPEDIIAGKATTESGNIGSRKFVSNVDISSMEQQVIYITIQSLIKVLNEQLKSNITKEDKINKIVNSVKWVLSTANVRLDYAITALSDLTQGVEEFHNVVLTEDKFDELLPEFLQFAIDNEIVLS